MTGIINFFAGLLGYLLWGLFLVFKNYGVAIIVFTFITTFVMMPSTLKQQKGMANQARFAKKQQELQKIYGNNKQKYNEELMKLQEKEGVNPMGGCLPLLMTYPVMIGVMYSISAPLSNTLHIARETVQRATEYVSLIPGASNMGYYAELEILRNFGALKDKLTMFTPQDVEKINSLLDGLNIFGLNLLKTPKFGDWGNILWVLPVAYLITSILTQLYTTRTMRTPGQQSQAGCNYFLVYGMSFFMTWLAFSYPAAVSFYFIMSALANFTRTLITNKFFSVNHIVAKSEARREASLLLAEGNIQQLSAAEQIQIEKKLNADMASDKNKEDKKKSSKKSNKKSSGKSKNTDNYLGNRK